MNGGIRYQTHDTQIEVMDVNKEFKTYYQYYQKLYNKIDDSALYLDKSNELDHFVHNARLNMILGIIQDLKLPQDSTILDVGSAEGIYGILLGKQGYNYVGSDISLPTLLRMKEMSGKEKLYSKERIQKKGMENYLDELLDAGATHINFFTKSLLEKMILDCGLKILKIRGVNFIFPFEEIIPVHIAITIKKNIERVTKFLSLFEIRKKKISFAKIGSRHIIILCKKQK